MLAQPVMLWTCTWEVPGANIGQETSHPHTISLWFPSINPDKCSCSVFKFVPVKQSQIILPINTINNK